MIGISILPSAQRMNGTPGSGWRSSSPYYGIYAMYACMKLHGKEVALEDLAKSTDLSTANGSSLSDLMTLASDFNTEVICMENVTLGQLSGFEAPLILYISASQENREQGHFVVLVSMVKEEAIILDPPSDLRRMPLSELAAVWRGHAILFSDTVEHDGIASSHLVAALLLCLLLCMTSVLMETWGQHIAKDAIPRAGVAVRQAFYIGTLATSLAFTYHLRSSAGMVSPSQGALTIEDEYWHRFLPEVTTETLGNENHGFLIIDARMPSDFAAGHMRHAVNMPPSDSATEILSKLSLILIEFGHMRFSTAATRFGRFGFPNRRSLDCCRSQVER